MFPEEAEQVQHIVRTILPSRGLTEDTSIQALKNDFCTFQP